MQQTLPATDEHLTQVDVNFLMGQTIRVNVSNVEKVNKFHIELPSAAASNKIIADYMANTDPQVRKIQFFYCPVCLRNYSLLISR